MVFIEPRRTCSTNDIVYHLLGCYIFLLRRFFLEISCLYDSRKTNEAIMKNLQAIADKAAISLSFICTVHCLALPLLVVLLPALAVFNLEDEASHLWMLAAVVPTSLFALTMGCKKHKKIAVMVFGLVGLAVLIAAVVLGHDILSETGEQVLLVSGAIIIALGHLKNHQLCKRSSCECHS